MFHYPGLDAMLALWGAAVLTYTTVRYFFFDSCIQIDLPRHRGRGAQDGGERN
ncbi:MAG TPA: hypothetical protein VMF58_00715 [Rhizomicrobium sp.]|nr:hypothetical protein [Rhizomicrobium sp.]